MARASQWLIPFVFLAAVRWLLHTPNGLMGVPPGEPPSTTLEQCLNWLFGVSFWFGLLGFLAAAVKDDSEGLAGCLFAMMIVGAVVAAGPTLLVICSLIDELAS